MQSWIRNRHPITLALMWVSRRPWWRHPIRHEVSDQASWTIYTRHAVAHG